MLDERIIECPWCWERFGTLVEPGSVEHTLVVDCEVCCRPIELTIGLDGTVRVAREE